ncbi:MAG TPA: single-stranded DNA-binding protein [Mycobacteriales bacterium]|nr:single-stranded DNA-binding protein [Mycobacteriales bacterium]
MSGALELPSGDTVVQLRVVVPRPEPRRGRAAAARRSASVDTIDVGVWGKALQRRVLKLVDGADVVVRGALRRRFWRGPGGPVSRYEVEASAIEVVRRG